jgi:hypothetical protein
MCCRLLHIASNVRRSAIGADGDGARVPRLHHTISNGPCLKKWRNRRSANIAAPAQRKKLPYTSNGRSAPKNQCNPHLRGGGTEPRKKAKPPYLIPKGTELTYPAWAKNGNDPVAPDSGPRSSHPWPELQPGPQNQAFTKRGWNGTGCARHRVQPAFCDNSSAVRD